MMSKRGAWYGRELGASKGAARAGTAQSKANPVIESMSRISASRKVRRRYYPAGAATLDRLAGSLDGGSRGLDILADGLLLVLAQGQDRFDGPVILARQGGTDAGDLAGIDLHGRTIRLGQADQIRLGRIETIFADRQFPNLQL